MKWYCFLSLENWRKVLSFLLGFFLISLVLCVLEAFNTMPVTATLTIVCLIAGTCVSGIIESMQDAKQDETNEQELHQ